MSNKIKVKRGTEAERTQATLDNYEIHYSTQNGTGSGQAERLWITDPAAANKNGADLLVGPFKFVEGPSGKIRVTANYSTGNVEIDYREPSTFDPTMSATFRANSYSNNAVLEAGDAFNNTTTGHSLTIASRDIATELAIDWGTYEYQFVGSPSGVGGSFPAPLDAQDNVTISGGTSSTRTLTGLSIPTPPTFTLTGAGNLNTRRQAFTVKARTTTFDGDLLDQATYYANFGWRVRGFISQQLFTSANLPTAADITGSGSRFHYIAQTPTTATSHNTTKFALPNDSAAYHLYIVTTCGQGNANSGSPDEYGWTPSLVQTNAAGVVTGTITPLEVTDYANGDLVIASIGGTNNSALGNQNAKAYRVWRLTSAPQPGNGDTVYTIIT